MTKKGKKTFLERLDLEKNPLMKELDKLEGEVKFKDMPRGWGDLLIETWKEEGALGTLCEEAYTAGNEFLPPEFLYFIDNKGYDNEDCEVMYFESVSSLIEDFIEWMLDEDDYEFGYEYWKTDLMGGTEVSTEFTEEKFKQIIDWAKNLKTKIALVAAEH